MKKQDLAFAIILLIITALFVLLPPLRQAYLDFNRQHGMVMSFVKFALLATLGEMIAARILQGHYLPIGFGLLPRMLVWGILGIAINVAFIIFSNGGPSLLAYLGLADAPSAMAGSFSGLKLLDAFTISLTMNLIFAPIMMTLHKITDMHIEATGGQLRAFFSPIGFAKKLQDINWPVMWNFVFSKTIPFFWIPAHTITFLLPAEFRVLFAALLGIALGLILALAKSK